MAPNRVQSKSIPMKKLRKRTKRSSHPSPAIRNSRVSGLNTSASPAEPINTLASQSPDLEPTAGNAQTLSSAAPDAPRTSATDHPHPPVSNRQSQKDLPKWIRLVARPKLILAAISLIVTIIGVNATIKYGKHVDASFQELMKQIKPLTHSHFTEVYRHDQVC